MTARPGSSLHSRYAQRNAPAGLYKFFPYDNDERQGWAEEFMLGTAYFSLLPEFNDPFEGKMLLVDDDDTTFAQRMARYISNLGKQRGLSPAKRLEGVARAKRKIERNPRVLLQELNRNHQQRLDTEIRVWCASGTREAPLMWSHYCHKHTGICVRVDSSRHPFTVALKVAYDTKFPTSPLLAAEVGRDAEQLFEASVLTKAQFWDYEDEYRLLSARMGNEIWHLDLQWNDERSKASFASAAVKGVTMGLRMPAEARARLLKFLADNRPDIHVDEARRVEGRYELAFAPLHNG